jgi:hypothetical protein
MFRTSQKGEKKTSASFSTTSNTNNSDQQQQQQSQSSLDKLFKSSTLCKLTASFKKSNVAAEQPTNTTITITEPKTSKILPYASATLPLNKSSGLQNDSKLKSNEIAKSNLTITNSPHRHPYHQHHASMLTKFSEGTRSTFSNSRLLKSSINEDDGDDDNNSNNNANGVNGENHVLNDIDGSMANNHQQQQQQQNILNRNNLKAPTNADSLSRKSSYNSVR